MQISQVMTSEFKHWYVYRERNDKNPTAKCEKFWFPASLLINLQIMQVFRI